ncbi:MAG: hypothetical protein IJ331_03565, partial [Ruminococcus sp.]|nr:hypothetical protein [Ruminococcus sp.]
FDDNSDFGKHYADNISYDLDNFSGDSGKKTAKYNNDENEASQPDYGDDFYAGTNNFEAEDDDDFQPVISRQSYSRTANIPDKNKNKSIIILVLCVVLALVIFVFSLILFTNSRNKDNGEDKKPTQAPTTMSEAATETEPAKTETEAPTQKPTQAPTQEQSTQAPVIEEEESTDAPPVEETAPPIVDPGFDEPDYDEDIDDVEPSREVIS